MQLHCRSKAASSHRGSHSKICIVGGSTGAWYGRSSTPGSILVAFWGCQSCGACGTPCSAKLGSYFCGTGEIVPFVNRTVEWGVVIATFLSVLSIVPV